MNTFNRITLHMTAAFLITITFGQLILSSELDASPAPDILVIEADANSQENNSFLEGNDTQVLSSSAKKQQKSLKAKEKTSLVKSFTKRISNRSKRYRINYYDLPKKWLISKSAQTTVVDTIVEVPDEDIALFLGSPSQNATLGQSEIQSESLSSSTVVSPSSLSGNTLSVTDTGKPVFAVIVTELDDNGLETVVAINTTFVNQGETTYLDSENTTSSNVLTNQSNAIVQNIRIDSIIPVEGDFISATPELVFTALDNQGISTINVSARNVITNSDEEVVTELLGSSTSEEVVTASFTGTLPNGDYVFSISILDTNGDETVAKTPTVSISDSLTIKEFISGPNPFNPHKESCSLQYQLSVAADVTLYIYSISGELQYRAQFPAGLHGGSAGLNTVEWSGINRFNEVVANAPYIAYLSAEANGVKEIKKHKILVLK